MGKHLWELGFFKDKTLALEAFARLKEDGYIRYEDLPLETRAGCSIAVEFVSNVYLVGNKKIIQLISVILLHGNVQKMHWVLQTKTQPAQQYHPPRYCKQTQCPQGVF
jgi:hypothetical protein